MLNCYEESILKLVNNKDIEPAQNRFFVLFAVFCGDLIDAGTINPPPTAALLGLIF